MDLNLSNLSLGSVFETFAARRPIPSLPTTIFATLWCAVCRDGRIRVIPKLEEKPVENDFSFVNPESRIGIESPSLYPSLAKLWIKTPFILRDVIFEKVPSLCARSCCRTGLGHLFPWRRWGRGERIGLDSTLHEWSGGGGGSNGFKGISKPKQKQVANDT